ncbi:MAG: MFS transporter [Lentisphaerota bacterium]
MSQQIESASTNPAMSGSARYSVGTLVYTKAGLVALFAWLLWGDFCFMLMELVGPTVLPLKLKQLEAPNWLIGLILTTLPSLLSMTVCPWVSFKSDRYRSRWGRRIPFILFSLPFLCISLVLLGWSQDIGFWLQRMIGPLQGVAPATITIGLIALFMLAFRFFDLFVGSVFHCLFNDLVPPQFLGRFMGLFRIIHTTAGACYSIFIFKYAETSMREIFTGAALVYLIGVGLMCLMVKEGKYPPVEDKDGIEGGGFISGIKSFGKESFSHRLYWYSYLTHSFTILACGCGIFTVFFQKEMGLTLEQIGWLAGVGGVAGLVATAFAAAFVDRWHPLRIMTYLAVFSAVMGFTNWVWVPVTLPGHLYFWLGIGITLTSSFSAALQGVSAYTMLMRIYPKSRYAQFCSARALLVAVANMIAGLAAGLFLDGLKWFWPEGGFCYRWLFVWSWPFTIVAAVLMVRLYREWRRLGGDEHYRPPASWSASGRDEMSNDGGIPIVLKPQLTLASLHAFTAGFVITLLLTPVFLFLMQRHGLNQSAYWYALVFTPLMLLITAVWLWQVRSVKRDIKVHLAGGTPRFGIPHHGVLLVMGIQGLIAFPLYWMQIFWTIDLDMPRDIYFFALAKVFSSAAILVVLQVLRLMERHEPAADQSAETSVNTSCLDYLNIVKP